MGGGIVGRNLERGELAKSGDADALERVAYSGVDVFERERSELLEAELSQRIGRGQRKSRRRLVEAQQVGLVVKQLQPDAERNIEEPWFGVTDAVILEQEADLRIQDDRFAAAEQVGIAEREVAEQRLIAVESAGHLERGGVGLSHVEVEVDLVGLGRGRGGESGIAVEAQAADA